MSKPLKLFLWVAPVRCSCNPLDFDVFEPEGLGTARCWANGLSPSQPSEGPGALVQQYDWASILLIVLSLTVQGQEQAPSGMHPQQMPQQQAQQQAPQQQPAPIPSQSSAPTVELKAPNNQSQTVQLDLTNVNNMLQLQVKPTSLLPHSGSSSPLTTSASGFCGVQGT